MPAARHTVRRVSGHEIHTLANARVSLSLAPVYGARVVSLRDLASRREWFDGWAPASARRLHPPSDPADFLTGPQAGLDECLPSITRCLVSGREIPDHGETWNTPAPLDPAAAARGEFVSTWKLHCLPLDFTRRITLSGATVRFDYALTNRAGRPTPFLWAWHPLFARRPGDRMEFAPSVRKILDGRRRAFPWPRARPGCDLSVADLVASGRKTFKGFVGPLAVGAATLRDARGPTLSLRWPAAIYPYVGVYMKCIPDGHRHWAIEPTNARTDGLDRIVHDRSPLHWLAPRETRSWFVTARVG